MESNTLIGTPLYEAGVDRGDRLVQLGDVRLVGLAELDRVLRNAVPGQEMVLSFQSKGRDRSATVRLLEDPALEVVLASSTGSPASLAQIAFRRAWLGSH